MGLTDAVAALIAAQDAMRMERSEANAEAVAAALDAIILRSDAAEPAASDAPAPEGEGA